MNQIHHKSFQNDGSVAVHAIALMVAIIIFFALAIIVGRHLHNLQAPPEATPPALPEITPEEDPVTEPIDGPAPQEPPPPPIPTPITTPTPNPGIPLITSFFVSPLSVTQPEGAPANFFINATVSDADMNLANGQVQIRLPVTGALVRAPLIGNPGREAFGDGINISNVLLTGNSIRVDFVVELPTAGRIDMGFRVIDADFNPSAERLFFITSRPGAN